MINTNNTVTSGAPCTQCAGCRNRAASMGSSAEHTDIPTRFHCIRTTACFCCTVLALFIFGTTRGRIAVTLLRHSTAIICTNCVNQNYLIYIFRSSIINKVVFVRVISEIPPGSSAHDNHRRGPGGLHTHMHTPQGPFTFSPTKRRDITTGAN